MDSSSSHVAVAAATSPPQPWYADTLVWLRWLRGQPAAALSLTVIVIALTAFLGWVPLFTHHTLTALGWIRSAWNPETHYEHGPLIPLLFLFLIWHAQARLKKVPGGSSRWGLAFLGFGVALYLLSARALQPRLAWAALPFLLFGAVLYVWGRAAARALLFPCAFLFFMIPMPGIDQATVRLQLIATKLAGVTCNLLGLHMVADGTTLRAANQSFQFEVADGCSGINSLMAITMLTAIFVHLTQDRLWKKIALFAISGVFAVVGNVARLTSIMVAAKFFGQEFAGGIFHHWLAPVVSFVFAFVSMWFASTVVNWRPSAEQRARWLSPTGRSTAEIVGSAAIESNNADAGVPARRRPAAAASAYDY
ncbi:MAG: exosortase/archaeosortase family protein [Verrucomicrobia bacterium]|nr:exosortase/archaeosortase family protein [Verrucomicrobiota bacterium]